MTLSPNAICRLRATVLCALPLLLGACASVAPQAAAPLLTAHPGAKWFKLPTEAYKGKQDDIVFTDASHGYYVNGAGKIFKTVDGGQSWKMVLHKPGTYF